MYWGFPIFLDEVLKVIENNDRINNMEIKMIMLCSCKDFIQSYTVIKKKRFIKTTLRKILHAFQRIL